MLSSCQFVWASNCQFILERVFKDLNSLRQLCGKYFSFKFFLQKFTKKRVKCGCKRRHKHTNNNNNKRFGLNRRLLCFCRNAFAIQIVTIKNIKPYNFFFISCHLRNFVVQIFFICSSWNILFPKFSPLSSSLNRP